MSTSNKTKKNVKRRKVSARDRSQKVDPKQLELLEFFSSRKLSKEELQDIQKLITDYYAEKVDQDVDRIFKKRDWNVKDKVKEWGEGHYRVSKK